MRELIEELRKITDRKDDFAGEAVLLREMDYSPKIITKNDFKAINNNSNAKIAFIDGGNAEILSSPDFSLHIIRIYCCTYENKKKLFSRKYEFWSLAKPIISDKLAYEIKIIGSNLLTDLVFDPSDATLKDGIHDASISKFGNVVRRFAELKAADEIVGHGAEIIVLDGDLQRSYAGEDAYLNSLIQNCNKNNIKLMAISKTNSTLTNKGRSALQMLSNIAPTGIWSCKIAEKNSQDLPDICFAKLHPSAKHVFRIDHFDEDALGVLLDHSKDPIFLGYPYGLIEADGFARVSNREKQLLRTAIMTKLGQKSDLISLLSNSDAHQILDRLQY